MKRSLATPLRLGTALLAAATAMAVTAARPAEPTRLAITTLSTNAQRVTGGDVLCASMSPAHPPA